MQHFVRTSHYPYSTKLVSLFCQRQVRFGFVLSRCYPFHYMRLRSTPSVESCCKNAPCNEEECLCFFYTLQIFRTLSALVSASDSECPMRDISMCVTPVCYNSKLQIIDNLLTSMQNSMRGKRV